MNNADDKNRKRNAGSTSGDIASIATYEMLVMRIAILQEEKDNQEDQLKQSFQEIVSSLNIISLFKVATKQERPMELAKSGANMVLNLITGLILGKNRSIKGYLSAAMVERYTSMIIDNNLTSILSGIHSLFTRKTQYERSQE